MSIIGNMAGCYSPMGKTFIITDENGNEITGVVTEQEQIFTATDNDVREGMVYASENGVSTGTKIIPTYNTVEGVRKITAGKPFEVTFYDSLNLCDFTKMQAIICVYNSSMEQSVAATNVSIDEKVYAVNSSTIISTVSRDINNNKINFGFVNESENDLVIRYFLYKEIY